MQFQAFSDWLVIDFYSVTTVYDKVGYTQYCFYIPSSRLPLLSDRPVVMFLATEHNHR